TPMNNAKHLFLAALAAASFLALPQPAGAEVKVAATLGDLSAAVREVGGDHVSVETLARPQEDPHYVDAKPSYIRTLSQVDLLVVNGMSLEVGWLPELLENARNSGIQEGTEGYFDASTVVQRMGVPDTAVTRKMGDVHPEGNPHYTLDPRQMARVAIGLGKRLGKIDPAHKKTYQKRARAFAKECLKVAQKWEKKFAELPEARRRVAVYHEAWEYVIDGLKLEKAITVEPKPGVDPNPKHVAKVIETMKSDEVPAILKMEYYPNSTAQTIADKTDATLVSSQGHTRDGQDYIERIEKLAKSIYEPLAQ
ncbi:MAG: metal ABC transporter substrate-binding protein, partial [Bradymonadaceae bacterium]